MKRRHTDPASIYDIAVNLFVYTAVIIGCLGAAVTIIRFIIQVLT